MRMARIAEPLISGWRFFLLPHDCETSPFDHPCLFLYKEVLLGTEQGSEIVKVSRPIHNGTTNFACGTPSGFQKQHGPATRPRGAHATNMTVSSLQQRYYPQGCSAIPFSDLPRQHRHAAIRIRTPLPAVTSCNGRISVIGRSRMTNAASYEFLAALLYWSCCTILSVITFTPKSSAPFRVSLPSRTYVDGHIAKWCHDALLEQEVERRCTDERDQQVNDNGS